MSFPRKHRKEKNSEFPYLFCRHCNNDFSLQNSTFKQENKLKHRYGHNSKLREDKLNNKLQTRIPLILHCGHSVCDVCIYKEINEHAFILCLQCNLISKVNSELKVNIRNIFPINYYYVGVLYYNEIFYEDCLAFQPASLSYKEIIKRSSSKDELCAECRSDAVKWICNECAMSFCGKCFGIVHKPSCFSHHKARSIEESRCQSLNLSLPMCEKHRIKVQFYCVKCQDMFCGLCVLDFHDKHNIQDLKVKNQELLPEFNMLVNKVKQILGQLKHAKRKVDDEIHYENKYKVSRINERIVDHFMNLHARLQMVEKQLQTQIEERSTVSKNHLLDLQFTLKQNILTVENLLELSSSFNTPENITQLNLLGMVNSLERALKIKCHLTGERNSDIDSTELVINEQFMSLVEKHCNLVFPQLKIFTFSDTNELSDAIETLRSSSDQDDISTASNKSINDFLKNINSVAQKISTNASSEIELKKTKFISGAFLPVLITHITSPSLFYIQHDDDSHLLSNLEQEMNRYIETTKVPTEVELNGIYFVQFNDSKWYRAVVKSASEDEVKKLTIYTVFYIDYGNEQNTTIDKLRPINEEFLKYPYMAHKCCLFNISPMNGQWSKEAVRIMAMMLDGTLSGDSMISKWHQTFLCIKAHAAIMDVTEEVLYVDLITNPQDSCDSSASVRDALIFLNIGCFVKKIETEKPACLLNESNEYVFHHKNFKVNDEFLVTVSHINSPSSFYVQLKTHKKYLEDIMENMKCKYDNSSNKGLLYTPKYGMTCAVKIDLKWYRGYIIGLPGKIQLEVFLLDYGNSVIVDWLNIRKLYDDFLQFDVQAIHCCLSHIKSVLESWSSEAISYFTEVIENKELLININNTETPNEVILYEKILNKNVNINALLVKKGLATSTGENSLYIEYYQLEDDTLSQCKTMESSTPIIKNALKKVQSKNEPYRVPVKVLSAQSPSCIYVCLQSLVSTIQDMQQNLNRFYGNNSKYTESLKWEISDKCAVHSEIDNLWYRGIICDLLSNNRYKVFIKDFARLETVKESQLRQLDEQFLNTRDGAVKCHMWGIQAAGDRGEWPMLACEKLQSFFDIYSNVFITKRGPLKDSSLPVDIWVEYKIPGGPLEPAQMEFCLLNQCLIDDGVVIPIKQEYISSMFETKIEKSIYDETNNIQMGGTISEWLKLPVEYNVKKVVDSDDFSVDIINEDWLSPLPFEENVEFSAVVTYIDNNMNFYLYNVEIEKSYEQMNLLIENAFENCSLDFENVSWQQGQACILCEISDETKFYRAKVLDVLKSKVEVHLVDYGSTLFCNCSSLRKTSALKDLPIKVTKCRLYGVESSFSETWPPSVVELIKDVVLSENVIINVKKQDSTKSYTAVSICANKVGDVSEYLLSMNLAKLKCEEKVVKLDTVSGNSSELDSHFESGSNIIVEDCVVVDNYEMNVKEVIFDDTSVSDEHVILENDLFLHSDDCNFAENLGYRLLQLSPNCEELEVTVVSISNNDCCSWYMQPEGRYNDLSVIKEEYNTLLLKMQQEAPNQDIITKPIVGQECVAKYKDDGMWYRGEILAPILLNKNALFILFVDYGNIDLVERSDVHNTKLAWISVPIQCFKCKLWNIKKSDCVDNEELILKLTSVLMNVKCKMKIKTISPLQVELFDIGTGQLLYQSLINNNILQYC